MTNKSRFALSWGRKIFFGFGLITTLLSGMTFLLSKTLPVDALGWSYFFITLIGWYGLLLSVGYFVIYRFFARFMASYYMLRFAALSVIGGLNLLIIFDSYLYFQYKLHLSPFIFELANSENFFSAIGVTSMIWMAVVFAILVFTIVFWVQGESIWRIMQGRFSNPVSNWYLYLIAVFFMTSHFIYYFGHVDRVTNQFLFPQALSVTSYLKKADKEPVFAGGKVKVIFYPKHSLKCSTDADYSLLFIALDSLPSTELSNDFMPHFFHLKSHAITLENHHIVNDSVQGSEWNLAYGIPSFYQNKILAKSPLETAIKHTQNELAKHSNLSKSAFKDALKDKFFMMVNVETSDITKADQAIYDYIDVLNRADRIKDTIIIVTAQTGSEKVPAMMLWPERHGQNITKFTSHYDFLPTILEENFHCKNAAADYSFGDNLFSKRTPSLFITYEDSKHVFHDLKLNKVMKTDFVTVEPQPEGKEVEHFMKTLKALNKFSSSAF